MSIKLENIQSIAPDAAGQVVTVFNITADGNVVIPNLRTTDPGAGSRQLWADPTDNYRVKWAP